MTFAMIVANNLFIGCSPKHKQEQTNKKITYTCEMHPEVTSDKPGKCTKCGMDLIKQ